MQAVPCLLPQQKLSEMVPKPERGQAASKEGLRPCRAKEQAAVTLHEKVIIERDKHPLHLQSQWACTSTSLKLAGGAIKCTKYFQHPSF